MAISVPERKSLGRLTGQPGETLSAALRRTLLDMILFGYFDGEGRIYPLDLARHFAVSPTPVREALMQLSTEGYIEAIPRRGFRIKQPSAQLVEDLWQVRQGLEIMAAQLAVTRLERKQIGAADIDALSAIQGRRDQLGARMSPNQQLELNAAFHQALVALSGNPVLIGIYGAIQLQVIGALVQRGSQTWRNRLADDAREHHAIIAAVKARDAVRCAVVIRLHIERSKAGALQDLAKRTAVSTAPTNSGTARKSINIRKLGN